MREVDFWASAANAHDVIMRSRKRQHFRWPIASIKATCDMSTTARPHTVMFTALLAAKADKKSYRARIQTAPLDDTEGKPLVQHAEQVTKDPHTGLFTCRSLLVQTGRTPQIERLDLALFLDATLPSTLGEYTLKLHEDTRLFFITK